MENRPIIDQTRPDQHYADFLYDKSFFNYVFQQNNFIDKKLSYRIINDAYILPFNRINEGGIFDSSGLYVEGSSFTEAGGWLDREGIGNRGAYLSTLAGEQNLKISDAVHEERTVVFIGRMVKTWGHFVADSMRLLWFLRTKEYAEKYSDCPLVYFSQGVNFETDYDYRRMLEILGIDTQKLTLCTKLTKYDKIILPDESFFMAQATPGQDYFLEKYLQRFYTPEYIATIDAVRDWAIEHSHPVKSKKIYFSHSKYKSDTVFGEDKLEKYFASKGYEIIYHPEKLTLDEELNVLVNCESFASTVGSCSHNIIFLRDNTEIILIPRTCSISTYQNALNHIHNLNVNFVDSSFSIFCTELWAGPFLYFISSNLRKFFHDEDTEAIVDVSDFKKYWRACLGYKRGRLFGVETGQNPDTYRYYSPVAHEYMSKIIASSWPIRFRKALKKFLRRK